MNFATVRSEYSDILKSNLTSTVAKISAKLKYFNSIYITRVEI